MHRPRMIGVRFEPARVPGRRCRGCVQEVNGGPRALAWLCLPARRSGPSVIPSGQERPCCYCCCYCCCCCCCCYCCCYCCCCYCPHLAFNAPATSQAPPLPHLGCFGRTPTSPPPRYTLQARPLTPPLRPLPYGIRTWVPTSASAPGPICQPVAACDGDEQRVSAPYDGGRVREDEPVRRVLPPEGKDVRPDHAIAPPPPPSAAVWSWWGCKTGQAAVSQEGRERGGQRHAGPLGRVRSPESHASRGGLPEATKQISRLLAPAR
jgi:hypothetical protein